MHQGVKDEEPPRIEERPYSTEHAVSKLPADSRATGETGQPHEYEIPIHPSNSPCPTSQVFRNMSSGSALQNDSNADLMQVHRDLLNDSMPIPGDSNMGILQKCMHCGMDPPDHIGSNCPKAPWNQQHDLVSKSEAEHIHQEIMTSTIQQHQQVLETTVQQFTDQMQNEQAKREVLEFHNNMLQQHQHEVLQQEQHLHFLALSLIHI